MASPEYESGYQAGYGNRPPRNPYHGRGPAAVEHYDRGHRDGQTDRRRQDDQARRTREKAADAARRNQGGR